MEKDLERKKLIKIVLFGPESTGKTTLTKHLADYFNTSWAREFLREFSEEKLKKENKTVAFSDLETIVNEQLKIEKEAENKANIFVFCDTNLLQTKIYSEIYFGKVPDFLEDISGECDLYFLTDIDVEWEKDNIRDAPFEREKHLNYFKKRLIELNKPFVFVSGNEKERLKKATELSEGLKKWLDSGASSEDFVRMQQAKTAHQ